MIPLIFFILGLIFGSFIGASEWRLHLTSKGKDAKSSRSVCESCGHILSVFDLIPVLSFVLLRGRCRYCKAKIGYFALFIEIFTGLVFLLTYLLWSYGFGILGIIYLPLWLLIIVGFLILTIYDFRWQELPTKVIYFLFLIALIGIEIYLFNSSNFSFIYSRIWGVLIGGGLFYILYQVSDGKWIGGGDIRLGALIGLIIGGPINTILMLLIASLSGLIYSIPSIIKNKNAKKAQIPFGPFLMLGCYLVFMFGSSITTWLKLHSLIV